MSGKGAFISGSTFLIDGGATASYFYGPSSRRTNPKSKAGSNRFRLFLFQSTISTETFCPVRCA